MIKMYWNYVTYVMALQGRQGGEVYFSHFTQYMPISPHGIGYKQTWYPPDGKIAMINFYKSIPVWYSLI